MRSGAYFGQAADRKVTAQRQGNQFEAHWSPGTTLERTCYVAVDALFDQMLGGVLKEASKLARMSFPLERMALLHRLYPTPFALWKHKHDHFVCQYQTDASLHCLLQLDAQLLPAGGTGPCLCIQVQEEATALRDARWVCANLQAMLVP